MPVVFMLPILLKAVCAGWHRYINGLMLTFEFICGGIFKIELIAGDKISRLNGRAIIDFGTNVISVCVGIHIFQICYSIIKRDAVCIGAGFRYIYFANLNENVIGFGEIRNANVGEASCEDFFKVIFREVSNFLYRYSKGVPSEEYSILDVICGEEIFK